MPKAEYLISIIFGLIISSLDNFVLSGPYLGIRGFIFSLFFSALAWFAGTALVQRLVSIGDLRSRNHRGVLWLFNFIFCALVALTCSFYYVFFLSGKNHFSLIEIFIHFIILFIVAIGIRSIIRLTKMLI